jgi:hypothetical protein
MGAPETAERVLKIIAQTLGDTPIQDITRQSRSLMIWASSKRPVRTLRFPGYAALQRDLSIRT